MADQAALTRTSQAVGGVVSEGQTRLQPQATRRASRAHGDPQGPQETVPSLAVVPVGPEGLTPHQTVEFPALAALEVVAVEALGQTALPSTTVATVELLQSLVPTAAAE